MSVSAVRVLLTFRLAARQLRWDRLIGFRTICEAPFGTNCGNWMHFLLRVFVLLLGWDDALPLVLVAFPHRAYEIVKPSPNRIEGGLSTRRGYGL